MGDGHRILQYRLSKLALELSKQVADNIEASHGHQARNDGTAAGGGHSQEYVLLHTKMDLVSISFNQFKRNVKRKERKHTNPPASLLAAVWHLLTRCVPYLPLKNGNMPQTTFTAQQDSRVVAGISPLSIKIPRTGVFPLVRSVTSGACRRC